VGTDGDVYPYLGLGTRLRARGHRVTLVANEHFRALAEEQGLAFCPLVSNEETHELLADPDFWHPLRSASVMSAWGVRFIRRQYTLLAELASEEDALLAASPAILAARLVQEKLSKPLATIVLQPWLIPSVFAPPIMPGGLTLPRWAPRRVGHLYWRLLDAVANLYLGRHLSDLQTALGLTPVRRVFQWWLSPQLVIGMFPEWYGPPQADWPPQLRLAGFPLWDGRTNGALPPEVRELCQSGKPLVAVTFGTGMMHAARFFRAAVDACRMLGAHGLFLTKYGCQLPARLPPFIRHCEFAPFQQLFPQCAAVVHHGGVGTVAKAAAAGTPQLIFPWAYDQGDNAVRVKRLGVGDWLKPHQRKSPEIANVLARLMRPPIRERCRAVACQFGKQDALEIAAGWVEELAHQSLRCRPTTRTETSAVSRS
jgi:UDP:flavonoid glycosyltransferase YjiC (YdhE family)